MHGHVNVKFAMISKRDISHTKKSVVLHSITFVVDTELLCMTEGTNGMSLKVYNNVCCVTQSTCKVQLQTETI